MHKRIIFRSMAYSDAIEKYIYKKIEKIYKYFKREPLPATIDIVLEPSREKDLFKVLCKINSIRYHILIQSKGLDVYTAIDDVLLRTVKEIMKTKDKMGHNLHYSYGV